MTRSQKGFTLVELLVYISLLSVIVLIAGQGYVDSIRFKKTTEGKIAAFAGTAEVSSYFEDDLAVLGAKAYQAGAVASIVSVVYIDAGGGDSSSFVLTNNGNLDRLTFRRGVYSNSGGTAGTIVTNLQVTWWVDGNQKLWRQQDTIGGNAGAPILMATGVTQFNIEAGVQSTDASTTLKSWSSSDSLNLKTHGSGPALTLTKIAGTGYRISGFTAETESDIMLCVPPSTSTPQGINLSPGVTYGVSFNMTPDAVMAAQFTNQKDLISAGFRTIAGGTESALAGVEDYGFFAGKVVATNMRYLEFSHGISGTTTAYYLMRFRMQASAIGGSIVIDSLRIWESHLAQNSWQSAPTLAQKKKVKALRLNLNISNDSENSHLTRIIAIPNNGV
jgi:prepilin-type N-terminal cleavage/methylation domain-containing protein